MLKKSYNAGPLMQAVLKVIPAYPDAANTSDLKKLLGIPGEKDISKVFLSFPSDIPICEDDNDYCYVDEDAKKLVMRLYGLD